MYYSSSITSSMVMEYNYSNSKLVSLHMTFYDTFPVREMAGDYSVSSLKGLPCLKCMYLWVFHQIIEV